jgi:MFS superfamily sulfate permease-like transporter
VLILRPGEPLFFANVERILGRALRLIGQSEEPIHTVILSLEESSNLDGTSIEALETFFVRVSAEDKRLVLARLKHEAKAALSALPVTEQLQVVLSGLSVDGAVQVALSAADA